MPAMDYSLIAKYYDVYVKMDLDIPFFLEEAKAASSVLELMSGTGRVSIPLAEAGVNLTCVDSSPDMLSFLRKKLAERALSACVLEMNACNLSLSDTFDLVIIPFHSFAEILDPEDQYKALAGIRQLLGQSGRFICTLHNPPVRLDSVNGKVRPLGKHPLPDGKGILYLSTVEVFDAVHHVVRGTQIYEFCDYEANTVSKSAVDLRFYVHEKDAFQDLAQSAGFEVLELYGDYSRSEFRQDNSPFMIWVFGRRK